MRVVWDGEAVRRTPRALKAEGRIVGFLVDQGALGLASTYVPFFGRPAKTPRGPAVFALRLRTPVVFGAGALERAGSGQPIGPALALLCAYVLFAAVVAPFAGAAAVRNAQG